jgi:hypothetical protein
MIELLLPYGLDTLEYSWVNATIGICTLADYSVAKKCQQLGKDILQDLVVRIDVNHIPKQIMSPCPQCHYHGCQLKIMSRIAHFVTSQLVRGVENHSPLLH